MGERPVQDRSRVVILGASNVTRGFSTIAATARNVIAAPIDILAALGHGRSYGMASRVLARSLPSIIDCGLWTALEQDRGDASTYALVTDVGNDIMYGAEPEEIADWVRRCVDRLQQTQARTIVAGLPLASIRRLGRWRYGATKMLFFPTRAVSHEQALERSEQTDRLLRAVAGECGATFVEPDARWYGFDPVHIRMRVWPEAWRALMTGWRADGSAAETARASLRRWLRVRTMAPEQRWWFGIPRVHDQPAGRLPDGTTVSLY